MTDSGTPFETRASEGLAWEYQNLLAHYMSEPDEATLYRASLLSIDFAAAELGPEDICAVHTGALEQALRERDPAEACAAVEAANRFLLEVMVHYGVKYREHREAELEQSLRAAAEAARLEREKSELLASIAHELSTPVTVARGFVQRTFRQIEARGDGELTDPLRDALHALDRLSILNRSLRHASAFGTAPDLELEPHPIGPILEPVAAWAALLAEESGLTFEHAFLVPERRVLCDRDAVTTICSNLLTNAVRYTDRGGSVRFMQDAEDGWVRIEVGDTGIGMTPEVQSQIFERFYRGPEAARKSARGLGLGLATTRQLVDAQQGRLQFESEPGRGTTFEVFLLTA